MKTKTYLTILLIGVGLIVVGLVNKNNNQELVDVEGDTQEEMREDEKMTGGDMTTANFLDGVLHNTDDPTQGNYKLIAGEGDIYIRTQRDFSGLVGRQVLVSIDGDFENFELLDIQSKVEDDGFIISQ